MLVLKKWIGDNQVDGQKFRGLNNQWMRWRNNADSGDVNVLRVNANDRIEFASVPQITAGTPSAPSDVTTVQFVLNAVKGIRDPKDAVRVASNAVNYALAGAGTLTIDDVLLTDGDRVLLKDQTLGKENGIYVYAVVGGNYTLTRADDSNTDEKVTYGLSTWSVEGTANARKGWLLNTPDPITVDVTALNFINIPVQTVYLAGDMLSLNGSTFSVNLASNGGLESTNPGVAGGQLRVKVDGITMIRTAQGLKGLSNKREVFTLIAQDITNGYVDLLNVAANDSIYVQPVGGLEQDPSSDYSINYTGGTGGKTRVAFVGDLTANLAAGDKLIVSYQYL